MKWLTVFCGASKGNNSIFECQVNRLGELIATRKIGLVYGGAKIGLMGVMADAVLSYNGKVIGVLPDFLKQKEVAHENLTELIIVGSMHERKLKMHELSDGVIALPGGFGTFDELFEMLTWGQLGLHRKPIGLLNIDGFYDDLVSMIEKMVDKGFLTEQSLQLLLISDDREELLNKMESYSAPEVNKIITKERT